MEKSISFLLLIILLSIGVQGQVNKLYEAEFENDVRKIHFLSESKGYVAFSKWIGFTQDSGKTFEKRHITVSNVDYSSYSVNLTFGFKINGVYALDEKEILVYGDYGLVPAILHSSNGGDSYKLIFHSRFEAFTLNSSITDMIFPGDGNTGYAADMDRVLKTMDRGKTWQVVRNDRESDFQYLTAIDAHNLFVISTHYAKSKILKTSDGGLNWQKIDIPAGRLTYAYFLSPTIGWINIDKDQKGSIYYTNNGGATWDLQNNPEITSFRSDAFQFVDNHTGYGVSLGYIYKTQDAGKIWEPLPSDYSAEVALNKLFILDSLHLWAGGYNGLLVKTSNGGGTTLPVARFSVDTSNLSVSGKVQLRNYSRTHYSHKWYRNSTLISTEYHTSYNHDFTQGSDSITLIVSNGRLSDTMAIVQYFNNPNAPKIESFSPTAGSEGTVVNIHGSNFAGVIAVSFGEAPASSFTILTDNHMQAVVGDGASGSLQVKTLQFSGSAPGFVFVPDASNPAPVIHSISPDSGPVGTVVRISGGRFDAIPANNIVYFGGTRATVTAASQDQLTCIVPTGATYLPVTALNSSTGLSAASLKPFNVTYPDTGHFTRNSYKETYQSRFPGSASGSYFMADDLDNDGKPDLVVKMSTGGQGVYALRNNGSKGSFSFEDRVRIAETPTIPFDRFKLVDIDGDGKKDIIAPGNLSPVMVFARNNSSPGHIQFEPRILLPAPFGSMGIAAGDLDNNGKPDIAIAGQKVISIIRNTSVPGTPAFARSIGLDIPFNAIAVEIADMDGDGKNDIICSGGEGVMFSVFRNKSAIGALDFHDRIDVLPSEFTSSSDLFYVVDLNSDNKLDVILLSRGGYTIYLNTSSIGNISFADPVFYPVSNLREGTVANFSGDNKPDLAIVAGLETSLQLSRNTSSSQLSFDPPVSFGRLGYTSHVNVTDFDMDGKHDLTVVAQNYISTFTRNLDSVIVSEICEKWQHSIAADLDGDTYQWQINKGDGYENIDIGDDFFQGANKSTLTLSPVSLSWDGYKFRCLADGKTSSVVLLKVRRLLNPTVEIEADKTVICYGTPVTFTAHIRDTSYSNYFNWVYNGTDIGFQGDTAYTVTFLKEGDRMSAKLRVEDMCAEDPILNVTSNVIHMNVKGEPAELTISGPGGVICVGTPVTYTSFVKGGGENPTFAWYLNDTKIENSNSNSITIIAEHDQDDVYATMTTRAADCGPGQTVESNHSRILLTSSRPPILELLSPASNCTNAPLTFNVKITPERDTDTYYWYSNGRLIRSGEKSLTISEWEDGDSIKVIVKTTSECGEELVSESNIVTLVKSSWKEPVVTLNASAYEICRGTEVVFNAVIENSDANQTLQWYLNDVKLNHNANSYKISSLTNNDMVKVVLSTINGCGVQVEVNSNVIKLSVKELMETKVEIHGDTTMPAGQLTSVTAHIAGAGSNYTIQWQEERSGIWSDVPGANNSTFSFVQNDLGTKLRCLVKVEGCVLSNEVYSDAFTVSVENKTSERSRIYPNPVNDYLVLDSLRENFETLEIINSNATGKIVTLNVKGQQKITVPTYSLPKGVYVIILTTAEGKREIRRFFKL
ncbi:MAG: VCBS repeat-containing protein [Chitinophagaceae bacterium]|nr:VCBS repeat-containing protein [Chitinophagaceae bacterium]MCW5928597.1 VCBS repeat-containing protein [Chitinophagaceae bacterium]